jgi:hypothetical protein
MDQRLIIQIVVIILLVCMILKKTAKDSFKKETLSTCIEREAKYNVKTQPAIFEPFRK